MPQLDLLMFRPSVFWILLVFNLFYILYSKEILPKLMFSLKLRRKKFYLCMILKINRILLKNMSEVLLDEVFKFLRWSISVYTK